MFLKIPSSCKLLIRFISGIICSIVFLLFSENAKAQDTLLNKFNLWLLNDIATFKKTVAKDTGKRMIDVQKFIPSINLDLKYCTKNNFMHSQLYPHIKTTYLRYDAVASLAKVQEELQKQHLGIKIWDAYRPYSVTEKMWEPVKDDRYAADPKFGSGHNRGIAVDVTLINLLSGKELCMGTNFDNFSDTAHADYRDLPSAILINRQILQSTMEKYGFKILSTEWWHFYLPDTKKYELLNLSFKDLKTLNKNISD